jgi:predicted 2-oxoglutarate/Fe(II)-dependent dioxygenase YbiX
MNKLYIKRKDLNIESLYDMRDDKSSFSLAGVYRDNKSKIDKSARSTKYKNNINPDHYPEITKSLTDMISIWDSTLNPADYIVKEFNYLKYGEGDHFVRHHDHIKIDGERDPNGRVFSTSTIISKSDDLRGGDFIIWDQYNIGHNVSLDVGETIFFTSFRDHQVNKVLQGNREVLVAWIYKRT